MPPLMCAESREQPISVQQNGRSNLTGEGLPDSCDVDVQFRAYRHLQWTLDDALIYRRRSSTMGRSGRVALK